MNVVVVVGQSLTSLFGTNTTISETMSLW